MPVIVWLLKFYYLYHNLLISESMLWLCVHAWYLWDLLPISKRSTVKNWVFLYFELMQIAVTQVIFSIFPVPVMWKINDQLLCLSKNFSFYKAHFLFMQWSWILEDDGFSYFVWFYCWLCCWSAEDFCLLFLGAAIIVFWWIDGRQKCSGFMYESDEECFECKTVIGECIDRNNW